MGIDVYLQDENGEIISSVDDTKNLLSKVLPNYNDSRFRLANTIDPWGDTVFNRFQARILQEEWTNIIQNSQSKETIIFLKQVDDLILKCISGVHLYVKFQGD